MSFACSCSCSCSCSWTHVIIALRELFLAKKGGAAAGKALDPLRREKYTASIGQSNTSSKMLARTQLQTQILFFACITLTVLSVLTFNFLGPSSSSVSQSRRIFPSSFLEMESSRLTVEHRLNISASRIEAFGSSQFQKYTTEYVAAHSPLCLAHGRAYMPTELTVRCRDWSHNRTFEHDVCSPLLERSPLPPSALHIDLMKPLRKIKQVNPFPLSIDGVLSVLWRNGTVVFVSVDLEDGNLSSILRRLLLVFSVCRRGRTAYGSFLSNISAVVLLVPSKMHSFFNLQVSGRYPFLGGFMDAVFRKQGVDVLMASSLSDLTSSGERHALNSNFAIKHLLQTWVPGLWDIIESRATSASQTSICFTDAVHVGSYLDRFTIPDAHMPMPSPSVEETEACPTCAPLPFPLSSDALALRRAIFSPDEHPRLRTKITYIASHWHHLYSFTRASEREFQSMLQRIAISTAAELSVLEMSSDSLIQFSVRKRQNSLLCPSETNAMESLSNLECFRSAR